MRDVVLGAQVRVKLCDGHLGLRHLLLASSAPVVFV